MHFFSSFFNLIGPLAVHFLVPFSHHCNMEQSDRSSNHVKRLCEVSI